jgi:D-serine deaminase-like pyridoxal phosphate-dependent protein
MTAEPTLPPISTPALVVDLDAFEANVRAMSRLLEGTGKAVRPHVKTHRTPELARRQLGGPVKGVTCATVGEAEAVAAAGIDDILVANEVVDPGKLDRLVALARGARVAVAVDAVEPLEALSAAASRAAVEMDVLIDVDILLRRCGVAVPEEALPLADAAAGLPGVRLRGIMGYEGRVRLTVESREARLRGAYGKLADVKEALERSGFPVEVVSAAGTSTLRDALADPVITEIQAGVYALMEPELLVMDLPFRCALAVRGTVVSRHPGRIVLDVGRRSIGQEYGPPEALGIAGATVIVNDEHAIVRAPGDLPPLGAHVDLRPSQIRTTCNLHDWMWAERGGILADRWPVAARGRSN